jgi:hypothetical protein
MININHKQIWDYCIYLLLLILSFIAGCISYAVLFWIHEWGHAIVGILGYFITHFEISQANVAGYINWPLPFPGSPVVLFTILVPTQTSVYPDPGAIWMAFGGIITVSSLTLLVGYFVYKLSKKNEKTILIFLITVIIVSQILSNSIFGTDNLTQTYFFNEAVRNTGLTILQILVPLTFTMYYFVLFSNRYPRFQVHRPKEDTHLP